MLDNKSKIPFVRESGRYEWRYSDNCQEIVRRAGAGNRRRAKSYLANVVWFRVKPDEGEIDAVVRGSEDYLVGLDFEIGFMGCECKAFQYESGPCKHIVTVCVKSIASQEPDDLDEEEWMEKIVEESRNSKSPRKPWEDQVEFAQSIADDHDADVVYKDFGGRSTECYKLSDDTYWTGNLPVPEVGDHIQAHLPTGEKVRAEAIKSVVTENNIRGFKVEFLEDPETFYGKTTVLFGNEIEAIEQDTNDHEPYTPY